MRCCRVVVVVGATHKMERLRHYIKRPQTRSVLNVMIKVNFVIVGFLIVIGLALTTSLTSNDNANLRLVHVVMRHGARTPVSTYPKDPYIAERFAPNGWGALTNQGILDSYNFGKFLRQRYDRFLGDKYNRSEYRSQSTDVDRALATLMAVNAGLWPPNAQQRWSDELNWLPIPIYSEPLDQDMLLLVRKDCPAYNVEFERVKSLPEVREKLFEYNELMAYMEEVTGQQMRDFDDIADVYTTLQAEEHYGLELPAWTRNYYPDRMEAPSAFSFVLRAYNKQLQRLKGGVLLKKLVDDWKALQAGKLEEKMFLYGGHDSTVSNLLSALQIFDQQVPGYGMAVLFEMRFDQAIGEFNLEIFVKNSTEAPRQMRLPDCDVRCPLSRVIQLTAEVLPRNWSAECAIDDPNYTPPPPAGP